MYHEIFRLMNEIELLKTEKQKLIKNNLRLKQLAKEQKALILNEERRFEIRFTKLLSYLFSPTQIDLILHPKKKLYKWLPSDKASAISLRSISPRTYSFLRETKKFPLPGYIYSFLLQAFRHNIHSYDYIFYIVPISLYQGCQLFVNGQQHLS